MWEKDPDFEGSYDQVAVDLELPLTEGLREVAELNVMKMMGALCNPLFQNKRRMIASGLCTTEQYEAGKAELLKRMCRYIEGSSANKAIVLPSQGANHTGNEWSSGEEEDELFVSPYMEEAVKEFEKFGKCNRSQFLPKMQNTKCLGTYDDDGHPRDTPVLSFGKVIGKEEDLPSGKNHADYINKKGKHDIVQYFQDHAEAFPSLSKIFIRTLAPHITTEVDCESLFSQAGHAAHPNRNRTVAETFERLVMAKHRISRIYCCPVKVLNDFMERRKKNAWSAEEDRNDIEFWEQQKDEYL